MKKRILCGLPVIALGATMSYGMISTAQADGGGGAGSPITCHSPEVPCYRSECDSVTNEPFTMIPICKQANETCAQYSPYYFETKKEAVFDYKKRNPGLCEGLSGPRGGSGRGGDSGNSGKGDSGTSGNGQSSGGKGPAGGGSGHFTRGGGNGPAGGGMSGSGQSSGGKGRPGGR